MTDPDQLHAAALVRRHPVNGEHLMTLHDQHCRCRACKPPLAPEEPHSLRYGLLVGGSISLALYGAVAAWWLS